MKYLILAAVVYFIFRYNSGKKIQQPKVTDEVEEFTDYEEIE